MTRASSILWSVSPDVTFSARALRFATRQVLALCFIVSYLLVLVVTGSNVPLLLRQGFVWYFSSQNAHNADLAPVSRVEHYVEDNGLDQLTASPQEGFPGWVAYTPRPNAYVTRVRLNVFKDTGCVTFYPRVFGADARIDVFEFRDDRKIRVFTLIGERKSWSPIGLRATVNLGVTLECESFGERHFEVVMHGNKVQLWAKGTSLVF